MHKLPYDRWQAQAHVGGKCKYLGVFDSAKEAARAVARARAENPDPPAGTKPLPVKKSGNPFHAKGGSFNSKAYKPSHPPKAAKQRTTAASSSSYPDRTMHSYGTRPTNPLAVFDQASDSDDYDLVDDEEEEEEVVDVEARRVKARPNEKEAAVPAVAAQDKPCSYCGKMLSNHPPARTAHMKVCKAKLAYEAAAEEAAAMGEELDDEGEEADGGASSTAMVVANANGPISGWTLAHKLRQECDISVNSAFLSCIARSRKGGYRGLTSLERSLVESFKVLFWGYVADCASLSMRSLKMDAAFDEALRAELGPSVIDERGASRTPSAGSSAASAASPAPAAASSGKKEAARRSSRKGAAAAAPADNDGSIDNEASLVDLAQKDLNVNLGDGLVVDGYDFLINYLASKPEVTRTRPSLM